LMLQVHNEGRSVVADGPREKAEHDAHRLHPHGLWATLEQQMAEHFRLVADGVEVSLSPEEVVFFGDLLRLLGGLGHKEDDPGAARLDPPVYLGDPEADAEWKRFARTELDAARTADRSSLEMVLDALSAAHARGEHSVVVSF